MERYQDMLLNIASVSELEAVYNAVNMLRAANRYMAATLGSDYKKWFELMVLECDRE